jgi:hypothetical protein
MASIDDLYLESLGLKSSSLAALHRHDMATVGDLRRTVQTEQDLAGLAGVGPVTFEDVRDLLVELGAPLPVAESKETEERKPRRTRLQGPTPPELSCIVAALIPAGGATAQEIADGLDIPLSEVKSSLRKLRLQQWVSDTRIGGQRHYLVPQDAVTRYRRWSRSVRWRCPRHQRHRLD